MVAATKVSSCDCVNTQQDKIHGIGRRVMNRCKVSKDKGATSASYRCTSCGKIK